MRIKVQTRLCHKYISRAAGTVVSGRYETIGTGAAGQFKIYQPLRLDFQLTCKRVQKLELRESRGERVVAIARSPHGVTRLFRVTYCAHPSYRELHTYA